MLSRSLIKKKIPMFFIVLDFVFVFDFSRIKKTTTNDVNSFVVYFWDIKIQIASFLARLWYTIIIIIKNKKLKKNF